MALMTLFAGHQWRNRRSEQSCGHGERGGEGEMYGEKLTLDVWRETHKETYITICKIDSQREFAVGLRELKQGLCINLEACDGEGDGREVPTKIHKLS